MGRPRKNPEQGRRIYEPIESFTIDIDGAPTVIGPGQHFREGHWIIQKFPHKFAPIRVHFDVERVTEPPVEQATAAPGEMRDLVA